MYTSNYIEFILAFSVLSYFLLSSPIIILVKYIIAGRQNPMLLSFSSLYLNNVILVIFFCLSGLPTTNIFLLKWFCFSSMVSNNHYYVYIMFFFLNSVYLLFYYYFFNKIYLKGVVRGDLCGIQNTVGSKYQYILFIYASIFFNLFGFFFINYFFVLF